MRRYRLLLSFLILNLFFCSFSSLKLTMYITLWASNRAIGFQLLFLVTPGRWLIPTPCFKGRKRREMANWRLHTFTSLPICWLYSQWQYLNFDTWRGQFAVSMLHASLRQGPPRLHCHPDLYSPFKEKSRMRKEAFVTCEPFTCQSICFFKVFSIKVSHTLSNLRGV